MNHVALSGYIARDIDFRTFNKQDGTQGCTASFTVACNRSKDVTEFISCTCFGKTAEMLNKYFAKGKGIELEGSIHINVYTNKDGQKVYQTLVWAERVEFPKAPKGNSNDAPQTQAPPVQNANAIPNGVNNSNLPWNSSGQQAPAQATQTQTPAPTPTPAPAPQTTQPSAPTPNMQPTYNDPYGGFIDNGFAPYS